MDNTSCNKHIVESFIGPKDKTAIVSSKSYNNQEGYLFEL